MAETVAAVSQQLADLRYQVAHRDDLADAALDALRLCRQVIRPTHCPSCAAAASLADVVLVRLGEEEQP